MKHRWQGVFYLSVMLIMSPLNAKGVATVGFSPRLKSQMSPYFNVLQLSTHSLRRDEERKVHLVRTGDDGRIRVVSLEARGATVLFRSHGALSGADPCRPQCPCGNVIKTVAQLSRQLSSSVQDLL